MRTWKWMFTAALLASVSASAQQPAETQPTAQPNAAAAAPSVPAPASSDATAPAGPVAPAPASEPPASSQQATSQAATTPVPSPSVLPQPTTMDQVVDRFIEREHGLMKALANRTPVVETYLQNLSADPP